MQLAPFDITPRVEPDKASIKLQSWLHNPAVQLTTTYIIPA